MTPNKYAKGSLIILLLTTLSACVSVPEPDPNDPLESYNRTMYKVNDSVDRVVLKPIATGYKAVVPNPVRTCITNIFGNLGDVWSGLNSMLQGRGLDMVNTFGRVLFNSTMGLGGCIDVASMKGAQRILNDFGTTLAVWGVGEGSFVVLPILGPSTIRDSAGLGVDVVVPKVMYISPSSIKNARLRNGVGILDIVNKRANLLDADQLATDISFDKYSFIRDAYLQNRQAQVRHKLAPEITDGTKVERASRHDPMNRSESGGDPFAKQTFNGYLPTTSDQNLDNTVPIYDDPDAGAN